MSDDFNAFFGKGYTEKKKIKKINYNVSINIMGKIYEGMKKIEITKGDVIIDGTIKGKMPCTSAVWVKIINGFSEKNKNSILTIVPKCDTMEGS